MNLLEETEDVINDEFLLKCICNYPAIYDPKRKGYSNRQMTDRAWENVARSIRTSVEQCQKRYKSLREKFHREKQKTDLKSGSGARVQTQWPLMSFFQYMYDTKEPRRTCDSAGEDYTVQFNPDDEFSVHLQASSESLQVCDDTQPQPCSSASSSYSEKGHNISETPKSVKRKKVSGLVTPDPNPFLGVLGDISSSIQNVAKTGKTDKINKFVNYVEAELRDLEPKTCEEFMDETLIRLLQVKRKQKNV